MKEMTAKGNSDEDIDIETELSVEARQILKAYYEKYELPAGPLKPGPLLELCKLEVEEKSKGSIGIVSMVREVFFWGLKEGKFVWGESKQQPYKGTSDQMIEDNSKEDNLMEAWRSLFHISTIQDVLDCIDLVCIVHTDGLSVETKKYYLIPLFKLIADFKTDEALKCLNSLMEKMQQAVRAHKQKAEQERLLAEQKMLECERRERKEAKAAAKEQQKQAEELENTLSVLQKIALSDHLERIYGEQTRGERTGEEVAAAYLHVLEQLTHFARRHIDHFKDTCFLNFLENYAICKYEPSDCNSAILGLEVLPFMQSDTPLGEFLRQRCTTLAFAGSRGEQVLEGLKLSRILKKPQQRLVPLGHIRELYVAPNLMETLPELLELVPALQETKVIIKDLKNLNRPNDEESNPLVPVLCRLERKKEIFSLLGKR